MHTAFFIYISRAEEAKNIHVCMIIILRLTNKHVRTHVFAGTSRSAATLTGAILNICQCLGVYACHV